MVDLSKNEHTSAKGGVLLFKKTPNFPRSTLLFKLSLFIARNLRNDPCPHRELKLARSERKKEGERSARGRMGHIRRVWAKLAAGGSRKRRKPGFLQGGSCTSSRRRRTRTAKRTRWRCWNAGLTWLTNEIQTLKTFHSFVDNGIFYHFQRGLLLWQPLFYERWSWGQNRCFACLFALFSIALFFM